MGAGRGPSPALSVSKQLWPSHSSSGAVHRPLIATASIQCHQRSCKWSPSTFQLGEASASVTDGLAQQQPDNYHLYPILLISLLPKVRQQQERRRDGETERERERERAIRGGRTEWRLSAEESRAVKRSGQTNRAERELRRRCRGRGRYRAVAVLMYSGQWQPRQHNSI